MKKVLLISFSLLSALVLFSCATVPEGFEQVEQGAYESKALADEVNAAEIIPLEYEAADSVLKTAEAEKEQKNYETAMELFQQADEKFVRVVRLVEFKGNAENVMEEAEGNIMSIDEKVNEINQRGGAQ